MLWDKEYGGGVLKIVQVGCSGHYYDALAAIAGHDDMKLSGFCAGEDGEDCSSFIKKNRDKYGFELFESCSDMFDTVRPDIAIVNTHYHKNSQICIEALKRNISCYSEKPAATTIKELESLKKAYEKSSAYYALMLDMRCSPAFKAAYNAVSEGKTGEVLLVTAQKSYKLGERPDFFRTRNTFGGLIPWVGIHSIDWIRWITGMEMEPVAAYHDRRHNRGYGELEIAALCLFRLENGAAASNSMDYMRPEGAPSHGDDRIRVVGSQGIVEVMGSRAVLTDSSGEKELTASADNPFELFAQQVSGGANCHITANDSFRATELALMARDMADEDL